MILPKYHRAIRLVGLCIMVFVVSGTFALAANLSKKKAKELFVEAQKLENDGKLLEAKAKYEQSIAILSLPKTRDSLAALKTEMADDLTSSASKLFLAKEFVRAIEELKKADDLRPGNSKTFYNLAACYFKIGDREVALDFISRAKGTTELNGQLVENIEQLKSLILTGESTPTSSESGKAAVDHVNKTLLMTLNGRGDEIKSYQDAELAQDHQKCKVLEDNAVALPKTAAVVFNLAHCAEQAGRYDQANMLFSDYLKLAPDPLDGPETRLEINDIDSLLAVKGEQATALRQLYAEAHRMVLVRKFDRAIEEYKKAERLYPSYSETKLKLGLIYEASGNVVLARSYLSEYLSLESNETARKDTQKLLSELDNNNNLFYSSLTDGQELAVQGNLQGAQAALAKAAAVFPLSPELNTVLAYVALKGNNPQVARRAFDIAWSFGSPVSFYAHVVENRPVQYLSYAIKHARFAKVEIERNDFRLIYLSPVPTRKKEQHKGKESLRRGQVDKPLMKSQDETLLNGTLPNDHLANISGSSTRIDAKGTLDVKQITRTSIRSVRTVECSTFVELEEQQPVKKKHMGPVWSLPFRNTFRLIPEVPFTLSESGWPCRKFANDYTRLFSQYLGVDDVELGAEHMTKMEKVAIAAQLVMVGLGGAGAAANATGNFSRVMNSISAAAATYSVLQHAVLKQRADAQAMDFKFIPAEPIQLVLPDESR